MKELATIFDIIIIACYFLLRGILKSIVFLVTTVAWIVKWFIERLTKRYNMKDITKTPNITNISINKCQGNELTKNIKEKLQISDKSIYDAEFDERIRKRGETYYNEGRVKNVIQNENNYKCIVCGSKEYNAHIKFDLNSFIEEAGCTCPYYVDNEKYCKHIYALLYKVKCSNNKEIIIREAEHIIESSSLVIKKSQKYIKENILLFDSKTINQYVDYITINEKESEDIILDLKNQKFEDYMIKDLILLFGKLDELKHSVENVLKSEGRDLYKDTLGNNKKNDSSLKITDIMTYFAILDLITGKDN